MMATRQRIQQLSNLLSALEGEIQDLLDDAYEEGTADGYDAGSRDESALADANRPE